MEESAARLAGLERELFDLQDALNQSAIVAVTDPAGKITHVNDLFCRLSKYSREELIGQNHRIVNSGYHARSYFQDLWATISAGRIWRGEIRNRAKDGTHYWVYTTIVPFLGESRTPIKYVSIRTDITPLKMAQEETDRHRAALAHSERMASLGEMAAGIAHELGNPLATIAGRMELLQMRLRSGQAGTEEMLGALGTVATLVDKMTGIIRGMRSLARDGASDPKQTFVVADLIGEVIGVTVEALRVRGIELRKGEIDPELRICAVQNQVSQILINLLNNARDAVSGLSERWIQVGASSRGDRIEISVTDSGRGIDLEAREKIFQPFFTTKAPDKGTGLGLSVSQTIARAHGGSLQLDTECANTRFVLMLPR